MYKPHNSNSLLSDINELSSETAEASEPLDSLLPSVLIRCIMTQLGCPQRTAAVNPAPGKVPCVPLNSPADKTTNRTLGLRSKQMEGGHLHVLLPGFDAVS